MSFLAAALSAQALGSGQSVTIDGNHNSVTQTIVYAASRAERVDLVLTVAVRDRSGRSIPAAIDTVADRDSRHDWDIPVRWTTWLLPDIGLCVRGLDGHEKCTLGLSAQAPACPNAAACTVRIDGMPRGAFSIRILDLESLPDQGAPEEIASGRCDTAQTSCDLGLAAVSISPASQ